MARKNTLALCLFVAVTAFVTHLFSPVRHPANAAPAPPPSRAWHRFAPIEPGWRSEVHLLRPSGDDDPPSAYQMVKMEDATPADKGCETEKRYYLEGQTTR